MKKLILAIAIAGGFLAACSDAEIASSNLTTASDNFEINRRIIFYNGVTGDYILVIEGLCSIDKDTTSNRLRVVCKQGPSKYKKHLLGLSDNVTFFAEQIEDMPASAYHYRVIFKPQAVLPNVDFKGSLTGN